MHQSVNSALYRLINRLVAQTIALLSEEAGGSKLTEQALLSCCNHAALTQASAYNNIYYKAIVKSTRLATNELDSY